MLAAVSINQMPFSGRQRHARTYYVGVTNVEDLTLESGSWELGVLTKGLASRALSLGSFSAEFESYGKDENWAHEYLDKVWVLNTFVFIILQKTAIIL